MASSMRNPTVIGAVVSIVLVAAGAVVWLTAPNSDASFGWFAYAPLSDDSIIGTVFLHTQQWVAASLMVVGLVIAGVAIGFRWGRNAGRVTTHRPHK